LIKVINGNSIEELKKFPDNYFGSVVTDPPYGLSAARNSGKKSKGGFMGKKWDYDVPSVELWQEVFRVLKEGGHLLAFAGTRTQHRMAVNIEDAGFEIRDMIAWVYGSGFPKSHNIGKAVDKNNGKYKIDLTDFGNYIKEKREAKRYSRKQLDDIMETCTAVSWWEGRKTGVQLPSKKMYKKLKKVLDLDNKFDDLIDWQEAEREITGKSKYAGRRPNDRTEHNLMKGFTGSKFDYVETAPATPEAKEWEGWGTALKPALEPITMARKPFKTSVAENVLQNGVGGINIDGCRVGKDKRINKGGRTGKNPYQSEDKNLNGKGNILTEVQGRFPANFIHDGSDEVTDSFPYTKSGSQKKGAIVGYRNDNIYMGDRKDNQTTLLDKNIPANEGSASRFFYCAKASKQDRNEGLEDFKEKERIRQGLAGEKNNTFSKNSHPTVKPTDLMRYLLRLVTPKNEIVLDCFMGSGSTGKACALEGFSFVGIDLDNDYCEIAKARIDKALEDKRIMESQTKLF
jgi:DNA modification methylase